MGRKSLIHNKLIRDTIIKYISNGNYIRTACMAAGVDEASFRNWQRRAEEYSNSNGDRVEEEEIYFTFFEEVKRARADNIAFHVQNIQDASQKNNQWTASAWLLERMNPAEYGKRLELEVGPSKILIALREEAQQLMGIKQIATETID